MLAKIVKDCTNFDAHLLEGTIVDCNMQVEIGSTVWEKYYRVYINDNDFEGVLIPVGSVESLDRDYIKLQEKIVKEQRERQIRFINSWINVVVNVGPRGGVREIFYNLRDSSNTGVNIIGKGKSKYYVKLLNELDIDYQVLTNK